MVTKAKLTAVSPSRARRDREKAETRRLILEAARALFTEEGYSQTSMRRIADSIGYTATTIYHHFADKDALLNELCLVDFRALADALRKMGELPDPIERLRAMGVNYVRFALQHRQQFRFMFMVERPIVGPDTIHISPGEDGYAFLVANVTEAMEQGRFLPQYRDPDLLAQIFWSGVHGIATIHLTNPEGCDHPWCPLRPPEETSRAMCDVLLRGLLRTPTQ
ncbi:MAG: TetR/AcrR family transcriptional regulator [Gemmatimonadaceae bacterium]